MLHSLDSCLRMKSREPNHSLDISKIPLPSDAITFKQIRESHPEIFDSNKSYFKAHSSDLDIVCVFDLEQACAKKAFADACGFDDPDPLKPREAIVEMLDTAYREYGLSSGLKQSRELIRRFEKLAFEAGRSVKGPSFLR